MLNNIKDFVIAKKEAFKVGRGPARMADKAKLSLIGAAIGAAIGLTINEVNELIRAIEDGEEIMYAKDLLMQIKE